MSDTPQRFDVSFDSIGDGGRNRGGQNLLSETFLSIAFSKICGSKIMSSFFLRVTSSGMMRFSARIIAFAQVRDRWRSALASGLQQVGGSDFDLQRQSF